MPTTTVFCALLLTIASAFAADEESMQLWPAGHPALKGLDAANIPTLTIYQPMDGVASIPIAVIVCPGGGYRGQTMGDEGHSVARWYAKHGLIGVVLKYRLPKQGKWSPEKAYSTLRDAQRAVATIRHKAKGLGDESLKVGILGFSAGGHLSTMTATRFRAADPEAKDPIERIGSRPDFACLIYPVVSFMDHGHGGSRGNLLGPKASDDLRKRYSGEFNVSKETPPIFMVHANDDGVKVENSFIFYQALKKQGTPVEMHIVSRGGHGFFKGKAWGIPGKDEHRFSTPGSWWPVWTLNWMQAEQLAPATAWSSWTKRQTTSKQLIDPK